MEKKELVVGGVIALAATGIAYYLLSARGEKKPEEENKQETTPQAQIVQEEAKVQEALPAVAQRERTFIMIKPDGV